MLEDALRSKYNVQSGGKKEDNLGYCIDEIDGGDKNCFMAIGIEKNVPPVGELPP